ncbi:MAG: biotin--[acetyl-CoA-carboxylase] ligase [Thermodesulfobacteria bacterium]|nr:biotin--[acetyl-CoA-carboxylase] ligase [Thermodesulfobacteriota bacterium]
MARLRDLEEEISALYHRRLTVLLASEQDPLFGYSGDEIFRRGRIVGSEIFSFERLPRTSEYLRGLLRKEAPFEGTAVLARELTAAKGRFGRHWYASSGGLWLAVAFYEDFLPEIKGWFPLLVGVALAEAVWHFGVPARLKWVNDLWIAGRKLAGVLIEEEIVRDERWLLVGIGLNVNNPLPEGLPAISLKEYLGGELYLPEVAAELLARLAKYYGLFRAVEARLPEGPSLPFEALFFRYTDSIGRLVRFGEDLTRAEEGRGRVLGLNPKGGLVIETLSGEKIDLFSGEIAYLD